jgi:hypothetical protein
VSLGGQITLGTEAGGQTVILGGQTTPRIEVGGQIATQGGLTIKTYAAPSSPASPTSPILMQRPRL